MAQLWTNNGEGTVGATFGSGVTTLTLTSGHGARFPNPTAPDYFLLTLEKGSLPTDQREIVKCTARSTDTLTVVRAQEGTSDSNWDINDAVGLRWTKGTSEEIQRKIYPEQLIYARRR